MVQLSRRRVLRTIVAGTPAVAAGGCSGYGGSDGDLRVENWDDTAHSMTLTMDRGENYDSKDISVSVDADSTETVRGVFTRSDWPYPFYLHIAVDGEYRTTTEHVWDDRIEVVLRADGTVIANETDRRVALTPAEPPPGGAPSETPSGTPTRD
jgi:hypothetical protein